MVLVTLAGSMLFVSCLQDDETPKPNPFPEESDFLMPQNERMMILGEQLENPYAIETMQRALHNLSGSSLQGVSAQQISLEPTHLYIKFRPQNEEELNILKRDSTLILYDHPLDFEILESGDYYHDPEIAVGQPTYQYCAVEANKQLPDGVEAEVLAELYIPDEDKIEEGQQQVQALSFQRADLGVSIDALVDEALRITNNLTEPTQSTTTSNNLEGVKVSFGRRSRWRPAGTIKVYDDVLERYVGVEGVEVRARRWFTTHKGIANSSGYYSCDGRFRRDANYSIDWERYHFALQDGWLNGATYNGPKKRGDWDLNLNSGAQQYYATIFRAAYHYYYGAVLGLRRPPLNSFLSTQMKIRAKLEGGRSSAIKARTLLLGAQVFVRAWGDPTDQIYGTTIHELAHTSHRELDTGAYNNVVWDAYTNVCLSDPIFDCHSNLGPTANNNRRLLETWATTVEIILTLYEYRDWRNQYDYEYYIDEENSYNYKNWQNLYISDDNHYTSAGYDMIDDINQRVDISPQSVNRPIDRVSGYRIWQLENALEDAKSWWQWRDNIKNNYSNETEEYLDELFANWPN